MFPVGCGVHISAQSSLSRADRRGLANLTLAAQHRHCTSIDPEAEQEQDLNDLVAAAHKIEPNVMLDTRRAGQRHDAEKH